MTPVSNLVIRQATPEDIPLIRELALKVWPQTYSNILTGEQINYMLELFYSENSLQSQMNQDHDFLILLDEEAPAGFASYSETSPGIFKLHKLYVLPGEQGRGAGRLLLAKVAEKIIEQGAKSLQLNVNRHNKARLFYEKLGFVVIGEEDIDIGKGYFMNDYIMNRTLY